MNLIRILALVTALFLLGSCKGKDDSPPEPVNAGEATATEPARKSNPPAPAPTAIPAEGTDVDFQIPTITELPSPKDIPDSPKGLVNGAFAPELDHTDLLRGGRYKLSDHVGPKADGQTKVAVVGFTASWCGPCRQSYPHLKALKEEYGEELEVVLVSTDVDDEGRKKEAAQVKAAGLDAPVLHPDADTLRAWLGRRRNVPHLYIINQIGEVLVQDRGFGKKVKKVLPKQVAYAHRHPEYVIRKKSKK